MTICQHIIIILHTILVSTRNFVTARPRNNIVALLLCLQVKSGSYRTALLCQRERQKENGDPRKGCERHSTTNKSRTGSCAGQLCRGNFVALFVSTGHIDQEAICIVSYPIYYHSYPAARILASITSLGVSVLLGSVIVA